MISFRFHLVSIIAIFLAIAIGVVMGTTVVGRGLVSVAESRTTRLERDVAELRDAVRRWEEFGRQAEPLLIDGQLSGRRVVVVSAEGVEFSQIDGVRRDLTDAGATVDAVLLVTSRMGLTEGESRTQIAELVGASGGPPFELAGTAARALATRLADGAALGDEDLLEQLVDGRFVSVQARPTDDLSTLGGPDEAVVVLTGADTAPEVEPSMFFVPLMQQLVKEGQTAVAGETSDTIYPFVPLVRDDGELNERVVTVDNADTAFGRVAVVLGLRDLLETGQGGDYGEKPGASSLLPPA